MIIAIGCSSPKNLSDRIVRGTGRYAWISGHGTYQLSLEIVAAAHAGADDIGDLLAGVEVVRCDR